jgi:hypothetical protein
MRKEFPDGFTLEKYGCTLLANVGQAYGLALVQAVVKAKPQERIRGWKVLSMIRVDAAGNPREELKEILSVKSDYDDLSDATITHVCDIDNDGFAEVIVKDVRYAGMSSTIYYLDRDYRAIRAEHVPGYSWD